MSREDFLKSLSVRNNDPKKYSGKKLDFNKLKGNVQKKIAVGLMAAIVITGFAGCAQKAHEEPTVNTPATSQSTTIDEYDYLNSGDAILDDFKERYVEAYNEKNGTNYAPSQISVNLTHPNYLYETSDGKFITHGNTPYETEDVLDKYGDYKKTAASTGNIDLIQIINSRTDSPIETYATFFSENGYIASPVYSSKDLDSLLNDLKNPKDSTLEDLITACKVAIRAKESDKLTNSLKQEYINSFEEKTENDLEH